MHGAQRRADYAFFITPNFRDVRQFVEAKKPFGQLATPQNYIQIIRYGWNAQTPIAVLTNFEQFHVLDCRSKPNIDTALTQCLRQLHYSENAYPETFAHLYHLFSREAVANGSLNKFAATLPKKRGRGAAGGGLNGGPQGIGEAFLEELDEYRATLVRSFKLHNPELDGDTLTEITQRTLDRLVFIRFLEDKLIYPENRISEFGKKGSPVGTWVN
jgi:adenine-specific DNA-methyltransferase